MPFDRPTLPEITERVREDLRVRLGLGAVLPRSFEDVIARALSLHSHYLHAHLDWLLDQLFPDTADQEQLEQWAAIWGVDRRQAVPAEGSVRATGSPSTFVSAGLELRSPTGELYEVTALTILTGPVGSATGIVPIRAKSGGASTNQPVGTQLQFTSPVGGLNAVATVEAGGLTGGLDAEDDESLRQRLLARIKEPPAGGAASDYERWALEVPGVEAAWVVPSIYGVGTVGVLVKAEGADPVPDGPLLAAVQAALDENRPVTATPYALAPTPKPVDFTIQLTAEAGVAITALRDAVEASIEDLVDRTAAPNATLYRSAIAQAISTTPGEASHVLTAPAADVVAGPLELFTMGVVTWS